MKQLFSLVGFILLMVMLYALYIQAKGLTWQFDDLANLKGLAEVSNYQGLMNFVFGGEAGPTGRPISLLAFVPNYIDWSNNPWGFVESTLVWHGINTGLVFLLTNQLLLTQEKYKKSSLWMATLVAAMWALLPIHASGILMPVQRMTHVSAFFILLTLVSYCYLRFSLAGNRNFIRNIIAFIIIVVCGELLAVYSKENGVVLITFIALVELFFYRRMKPPTYKKIWKISIYLSLFIVPVFMLSYLWVNWDGINDSFNYYRGRTLSEHLATQLVISWEYIRQIIFPRASLLGPFHDGHIVYTWGMWQPWVSLFVWLFALFGSGFLVKKENELGKYILFSLVFFLAAHQIESTIIPLELYFEHRNYLASFGFVVFIVMFFKFSLDKLSSKLIAVSLLFIYFVMNVFSLQQVTSLWGQPLMAAEMWSLTQPNSVRAVQTLSWQYDLNGFKDASLKILDDFTKEQENVGVSIQALVKACSVESSEQLVSRMELITKNVSNIKSPPELITNLAELGKKVRKHECGGVTVELYSNFLHKVLMLDNINRSPKVRHHIYYELASIAESQGDMVQYVQFAKKAFMDYPSLSIAQLIALKLFEQGENVQALEWIDQAIKYAPNKAVGESWRKSLLSLKVAIEQMQIQLKFNGYENESTTKN